MMMIIVTSNTMMVVMTTTTTTTATKVILMMMMVRMMTMMIMTTRRRRIITRKRWIMEIISKLIHVAQYDTEAFLHRSTQSHNAQIYNCWLVYKCFSRLDLLRRL